MKMLNKSYCNVKKPGFNMTVCDAVRIQRYYEIPYYRYRAHLANRASLPRGWSEVPVFTIGDYYESVATFAL